MCVVLTNSSLVALIAVFIVSLCVCVCLSVSVCRVVSMGWRSIDDNFLSIILLVPCGDLLIFLLVNGMNGASVKLETTGNKFEEDYQSICQGAIRNAFRLISVLV